MRKPLPFHRRVGRFIDRNPGQVFTYAFATVFGLALGTLVALGI
jgi:hypothetical protein